MNINFSPPRKQNRWSIQFALPQQTRLQNTRSPVLDFVTSPARSCRKQEIEVGSQFTPSTSEHSDDPNRLSPVSLSVPSRMKKRLSAGGRQIISSRLRKHESGQALAAWACRKVHFKCDEVTGDIIEHIHETEIMLETEDLDRAWLSRKDLRSCRLRAHETCRFFLFSRPDYQDSMLRLLVQCGAHPTEAFLEEELQKHHQEFCEDSDKDVNLIVGSEARGLEKRILNSMELPFHRHKRSIDAALDTQRRLTNLKHNEYFDTDKQTRLIASQYSKCTKYATIWARRVAQADAQAVTRQSDQLSMGS